MRNRVSRIWLFSTITLIILSTLTFVPTAKAWAFWKYNAGDDVADVGISADGNRVVAVTKWMPANLVLLERSGSLLWTKSLSDSTGSVSISGNGNYIVVGTSYKEVLLFDGSGSLLWTKELTTSSIYDVDISSDGRYIVVGGYDNTVYLYNNTGAQIWNFTAGNWVNSVSISSDAEYVAAGSTDKLVYFLSRDGTLLWEFNTTWSVNAVSVSPEGGFVAAANSYGNVSLFDNSGNHLWDTKVGSPYGVSVSANGEYIAVADMFNDNVALLSNSGAILWSWQADGYVNDVDISNDGLYVVAGSSDKRVYFLENLKPSKITCDRSQAQIVLGEPIAISGSINPPYEGVEVVLNYTKPDTSVMSRTVTSGADGSFSDTVTPDVAGTWNVRVWWSGNSDYMGAQNSTIFIASAVKDVALRIGENRTISDYFESPGSYSWPILGGGLYNESLSCPPEVNYTTQEVVVNHAFSTISSFNITYSVKAFESTPEGVYDVEAKYDFYTYFSLLFGRTYTFLFSYKIKLKVDVAIKYKSTISLVAAPHQIHLGENVSVTGAIDCEAGMAVAGANACLTYMRPDGSSFTTVLNTLLNGSFHESYKPDMPGSWKVNATWQGDGEHYGAEGPTVSFDVLAELAHEVVCGTNKYNVRTLTNSTLQDFTFNQSLMQISFNLVGPSDAGGFCNVTIPKAFLRGSPWTLTIDDAATTDFAETENTTHISLYFTYAHESPRHIVIQGTWVVPEFPSTIILLLATVCSLLGPLLIGRKLSRKLRSSMPIERIMSAQDFAECHSRSPKDLIPSGPLSASQTRLS